MRCSGLVALPKELMQKCVTGELVMLAHCRMKEWDDLSEYERKDIAEILAKLALDAYLHPPPSCRVCLRDDCFL